MLGKQPARQSFRTDLSEFLTEVVEHAKKTKVSVADVIAAKHAIELQRQNDLAYQDGDFRDEQMGGLGDRLTELVNALSELAGGIRDTSVRQ